MSKKKVAKIVSNSKSVKGSGVLEGMSSLSRMVIILSIVAALSITSTVVLGFILASGIEISIVETEDVTSLHAGEGNIETHNYTGGGEK